MRGKARGRGLGRRADDKATCAATSPVIANDPALTVLYAKCTRGKAQLPMPVMAHGIRGLENRNEIYRSLGHRASCVGK